MDEYWRVDVRGDEGAEDIEAVEDHALLRGEGKHEVDGFGVDCG